MCQSLLLRHDDPTRIRMLNIAYGFPQANQICCTKTACVSFCSPPTSIPSKAPPLSPCACSRTCVCGRVFDASKICSPASVLNPKVPNHHAKLSIRQSLHINATISQHKPSNSRKSIQSQEPSIPKPESRAAEPRAAEAPAATVLPQPAATRAPCRRSVQKSRIS